jgi:hypothetical protein
MECFGTTDFDNNSRLITLSAIIISGLHRVIKVHIITVIVKIVTEEERTKCSKAFQGRLLGKQQRNLIYFK